MQNQANLKCIIPKCGKEYPISSTSIKCECGNLLDVNYKHNLSPNLKEIFYERRNPQGSIFNESGVWRFRELLNFCGIKNEQITYTVDRSPHKQGLFLPGSHLPIKSPKNILETKPDYIIILAWNLKDEIMQQMKDIRAWGGKFVVPIPELKIY